MTALPRALLQLRQHEEDLELLGVKLVVVTFEIEEMARAYSNDTNLQWPLLVDSSREIYRAYGMERGTWWNIFGPASVWAYCKLMFRGRKPHRTTGDPNQLGGDVLVDPAGIVRLHHVGTGPADRPSVTRLLEMIRRQEPCC